MSYLTKEDDSVNPPVIQECSISAQSHCGHQDELFLLFQRMMDALATVQLAERALCKAVANLNTEDFAIRTRLRDEAVIKLEQAQEDVRLKRTQTLQKAKEQ